jgi:cellulose synthase/poly-beta-1,6-N-acetylglucosamine synthase-like glycosyltransferase
MHMAILIVGSMIVIAYTWIGYPLILWILRTQGSREVNRAEALPSSTIVIAAYNEERHIQGKLENCLALDYPADKIEVIVVSDGSTDNTERIVEHFAADDSRIRLLRTGGRAGKSNAQNLGVKEARGELLFMTDAGSRLDRNTLRLLAADLADPKVGLVSATLELVDSENAISKGQGLYWRYELFMRQAESDLGVLAAASGVALAMKKSLFRPLDAMYGEDCTLPLDVRLAGYRVLHNSRARAYDSMPHSAEGELRARIRMTARNWTGTLSRNEILNPLRYPGTALALISHKLLRWLTPLFLIILFLATLFGATIGNREYQVLFGAQLLFYMAAYIGWRRFRTRGSAGLFGFPFSFCLANIGFLGGLLRVLRSQEIIAYDNPKAPAPATPIDGADGL